MQPLKIDENLQADPKDIKKTFYDAVKEALGVVSDGMEKDGSPTFPLQLSWRVLLEGCCNFPAAYSPTVIAEVPITKAEQTLITVEGPAPEAEPQEEMMRQRTEFDPDEGLPAQSAYDDATAVSQHAAPEAGGGSNRSFTEFRPSELSVL